MERSSTLMALSMTESGETIREMEAVSFPGSMDPHTKENSEMIQCTAKEYLPGKVSQVTLDHGDITKSMVREKWSTKTKVFTSAIGRTISAMVKGL